MDSGKYKSKGFVKNTENQKDRIKRVTTTDRALSACHIGHIRIDYLISRNGQISWKYLSCIDGTE